MGVKKPAVIAKTAAKKRGRPVGSKNKPKTAAKKLAALGGSLSSTGWVPPRPVDWEKLAKQLQEALASEMKSKEMLEELFDEFKSKIIIAEQMPLWKRIKFVITGTL